jgi:hypothetical protein
MKSRFYKAALLAALGLASVSAVQASSFGDLLVGFTTLSGQDVIYDIGALSSLHAGETWSAGTLGITAANANSYNWGVVGSADVGEIGNPTALVYTTVSAGLPLTLNGQAAFNAVDVSISSLANTLPGGINNFVANTGSSIPSSNGNSWSSQTVNGPLSDDYHIAYLDPNGVGVGGLDLFTVTADDSTPTFAGGFTLDNTGTLTFSVEPVPEPTTLGLLGGAGLLIVAFRNKLSRKQS